MNSFFNSLIRNITTDTSSQVSYYDTKVISEYDGDIRELTITLLDDRTNTKVGSLTCFMVDDLLYKRRDVSWADLTLYIKEEYKTGENYSKLFDKLTTQLATICKPLPIINNNSGLYNYNKMSSAPVYYR